MDFVAYVAKDSRYGRACFVLECGGGLAQDVITTIGQAFELRFKEFLKKMPKNQSGEHNTEQLISSRELSHGPDDPRDYYNDLPGKVPPDIKAKADLFDSQPNLIDLNTDLDTSLTANTNNVEAEYVNCSTNSNLDLKQFDSTLGEHFDADSTYSVFSGTSTTKDPFDMRTFSTLNFIFE